MGAALEQPNVHTVEIQQRDQVERPIVGQEREGEISTSEFEFHKPLINISRQAPLGAPCV
jgi:hypothetical protein